MRSNFMMDWRVARLCVFLLWVPTLGPNPSRGEIDHSDRDAQIETAVEHLIAEAKELDELEEPPVKPVWTRPHPLLKDWGPEMGPAVLDRLMEKFTGNDYRDTYVRWHLIWAVQNMLEAEFERFKQADEHAIPPNTGERLVKLVQAMPGEIRGKYRTVDIHEPRPVGDRYYALQKKTRIKVGFPPFEREYWGDAALPHHPKRKQTEIGAIVAEMKKLRKQFKSTTDRQASTYNARIRRLNLVVREYRGDLIYAIIATGDPGMLRMVTREIARQVNKRQWTGLDLMAYVYLAAYDGYLSLYDERLLTEVSRELAKIARGANQSVEFLRGKDPMPAGVIPNRRNFGEYAFHMAELLETPDTLRQFLYTNDRPNEYRPEPKPAEPFTADNLTTEHIRRAIRNATGELYHPRPGNKDVMPRYQLRSHRELWKYVRHRTRQGPRYQEIVHETGNHALVCWALLSLGESYQNPLLFKRINWVLSSDTPYTYDRGMRALMLGQLSSDRWGPYMRRDVTWLSDALTDKGNWGPEYYDGDGESWGDHANGQYGVLGLWAAQQSGVEMPLAVWRGIDRHWRHTQQQTPGEQPAGWAVGVLNVEGENDSQAIPPFYRNVNGPMTAAGVATLTLTERYLYGAERTDPSRDNVSSALRKGIAWLDQNFKIHDADSDIDWYYYMWTVQRVGQATGLRTFNGVDWSRQVTAEMLNRQSPDGLWRDPSGKQGTLLSTGFALLYLSNALDAVAVSKVRYTGNWNNRPNDLWNFADYASGQFEVDADWQIVDLRQPVYQLIESPLLYLAGDEAFELSDAEAARLREYIDAGGLLLTNPETGDAGLARSIRGLAERLFPGVELEPVPSDHPLYSVHSELRPSVQMSAVDNGVRPLMIHFARDIGRGLQANDVGAGDSFIALQNLYLYALGKKPGRTRLETNYVPLLNKRPGRGVRAARIKYGGSYDPEPGATTQLKNIFANDHDIDLKIEDVAPADLGDHKIALLTTIAGGALSSQEAASLRQWVEGGGTLWMDAAGGSMRAVDALSAMIAQIFPDARPTPLEPDHPIITGHTLPGGFDNRRVRYRLFALRDMGATNKPRLTAIYLDDRPAVIYSPEDLTAGLAGLGHWGVFGYSVESARQLVVNGVLAATADQ